MWMETILLRGTMDSVREATDALSALLSEINNEDNLNAVNLFQRHPEFGDLLVEIRWNTNEIPKPTRLSTMITRILERFGSIHQISWTLRDSLSLKKSASLESGENK